MNTLPNYRCPDTGLPLEAKAGGLQAPGGARVYPVRNGIPNFLRFPPVEDAEAAATLALLNERTRAAGWREGLAAAYPDEGMQRYVTDDTRASYLDLIPISASSDVLEIGPGLGQFTNMLAQRARSVHALEVVAEQAEFALARCRQQGQTNVELAVGGDDCRLPYADGSFDVVVFNLVFEWCAARLANESHQAGQERLLSEISRVLRPGGSLYLATKNRYSLRLLLGGRDEHQFRLGFGSALPRGLSAWLLRRRGHARASGHLQSHDALAAMLRRAGFGELRSYWATPEMRYPRQYVPTDAASVRKARSDPNFVQSDGRVKKALMAMVPAAWVRHVTPGLAFLVRKA
jgi:SAM-dependent methyltransferase